MRRVRLDELPVICIIHKGVRRAFEFLLINELSQLIVITESQVRGPFRSGDRLIKHRGTFFHIENLGLDKISQAQSVIVVEFISRQMHSLEAL